MEAGFAVHAPVPGGSFTLAGTALMDRATGKNLSCTKGNVLDSKVLEQVGETHVQTLLFRHTLFSNQMRFACSVFPQVRDTLCRNICLQAPL
jgi:hypothetical protein